MSPRPVPAHGTSARGYGSPGYRLPCKCDPCRAARNRVQKQQRFARDTGRSLFADPRTAQQRLHELHKTMSWKSLVAATGLQTSALVLLYNGSRTKIRWETHAAIMAVVVPETGDGGQYINATGTTRRVRALSYAGHSYAAIAAAAGSATNRVLSIANGHQPTVRRDLAERLAAVCRALALNPPATNKHTSRTKNVARAKGWAPLSVWDDDTIDDPNAHPDWTGYCGTDRGWWTHRIEHIPVCEPCQAAHDEWLQERKHLSPADRYRELGRARGEASNRGAAIAENARELMRLGADYEVAAQRIGVTRQHLQQELIRHPEQTAA